MKNHMNYCIPNLSYIINIHGKVKINKEERILFFFLPVLQLPSIDPILDLSMIHCWFVNYSLGNSEMLTNHILIEIHEMNTTAIYCEATCGILFFFFSCSSYIHPPQI